MRKLVIFALAVFCVSTAYSQASSASSGTGSSPAEMVVEKKAGKVIVPPEKLRPIMIPKLSSPIVIDGRPDEDAWKNAAVFKDFYQVSPGDNIARSKPDGRVSDV